MYKADSGLYHFFFVYVQVAVLNKNYILCGKYEDHENELQQKKNNSLSLRISYRRSHW